MDDDGGRALPPYDPNAPETVAARDAVGRAIAAYLNTIRPSEQPYVVAWVVGVEWTNAELEQDAAAGRDTIADHAQPISASCGLGHYVVARYT